MAHTKVSVPLIGEDGNAFSIIGRVAKALRRSGQKAAAEEYVERATNTHSYDEMLQVTLEYADDEGDCEQ